MRVPIDTGLAKLLYGDRDHRYTIPAEVRDLSRRTIVGKGDVLVARQPFKVYAWVDRGHYRAGDTIQAGFKAQTLDLKPVAGRGVLKLLRLDTGAGRSGETELERWDLDTDASGAARIKIQAARAGQYRLSYTVTDAKGHAIEGGYVFTVAGAGEDPGRFRFTKLELIADKKEYIPGDTVHLMVNTDREGAAVLLFVRPVDGVYLPPQVIRPRGQERGDRDRRHRKGHAQLLRRGAHGLRRQALQRGARDRRAAREARPERRRSGLRRKPTAPGRRPVSSSG